jgi:hypothetical protein
VNQRADELHAMFEGGTLQPAISQPVTTLLLSKLAPSAAALSAARAQLRTQYERDYNMLALTTQAAADAWIDAVLVLELAANLHDKDEMYIYSVAADRRDLAGAGLFAFLGFLYRPFRDHDYDLGRQKAQAFLTTTSPGGHLPPLRYTPKRIRSIQPTPQGGFTTAMIPEADRRDLYNALSDAADNILTQEGLSWVIRKTVETVYVNPKIKLLLGL